ncbi:MAG: 50S ribosomal protein L19 [Candidatus Uhrbacteria bacterium GW2011_GWD2_52_7]|uniref:50S ribosomal protein L19 n=1 Tax=Candidatus Uhrbacteria bacterium GW2011_GWD2_52_7 TaxID=1618989 RepID=A0A0G2AEJ9_9BACT|nr:MAG: 50S ribosomal protein L19 [Candidatus Uhrbacteria bacterium GW2011_GWD2_52_7]
MTEAEATTAVMPEIQPGMVVRVHEKIEDVNAKGEKRERIQMFEGMVLSVSGAGVSKNFVVRKVTNGYGVEKIYPVASPNIQKVDIVKAYKVRRANLSFIKDFGRKLREAIIKK